MEERGMSKEDFYVSEAILYDIIIVGTCHSTFIQTHTIVMSRVNPNVNNGLWVTMKFQC